MRILFFFAAFVATSPLGIAAVVEGDIRYFSPSLNVWTNAANVFRVATNLWSGPGQLDRAKAGQLVAELGNAGYVPAEIWMAVNIMHDPEGKIGKLVEAGGLSDGTSYFDVLLPPDHKRVRRHLRIDPFKAESMRWYRKAAEQGNPEAQFAMGDLVVKDDFQEAVRWYTLAAPKDQRRSKLATARAYESATNANVPRNLSTTLRSKAVQLYEECEAFLPMARICVSDGKYSAAYCWWCVGRNRGDTNATPFSSDYAAVTFSAAQRTEGRRYAAAYLLKRYKTAIAVEHDGRP